MRSFKVKVEASRADFFMELLDSLNFVSFEEDSSSKSKSAKKAGSNVKDIEGKSSSNNKTKSEEEYDSMDSKRKSLEDIRKAMMNIDKLRNNR